MIKRYEYGHTKQSMLLGPLYLKLVGLPSLIGCVVQDIPGSHHEHKNEWYEVWANNLSYNYHDKNGITDSSGALVTSSWDSKKYPLSFTPDWYFYATLVCYPSLLYQLYPLSSYSVVKIFF